MRKLPVFLMASAMVLLFSCGEGKVEDTSAESEEGVEELMEEADSAVSTAEPAAAEAPATTDSAAAQ